MAIPSNIYRFWLFLLIAKVYAALATPVANGNAAYEQTAAENSNGQSKLSNYFLHDPYGPNTYAFGYELEDAPSGNIQFRDERRYLNGSIEGSYGYVRPDGLIQVTRYRADGDSGYLAYSQSYAPGDEPMDAVWPTKRPDIFKTQHAMQPAANVSWDAKSHLNVSVDQVQHEVAKQLKEQHGLDLNHIDVEQDVLQPAVLDIVNGKAPLVSQPNGSLAFETLHNFIDEDLPLVPFELPAEQLLDQSQSKYNKAKTNNDEKAPQTAASTAAAPADSSTTLPTPQPLIVNDGANASSWYQRIIQANRREFLEHLPNLNQAENVS
ncbi:hypothetical protein AWZ03_000398 [Drosophila navojoa]|uniref:Cuticle protein 6 n=2 Tax=Drosophila navojoa TaxID=7232 RepID=A0A484BYC2_DRONA|nr:hypothetical protein AWZ03_000398 [Drosophila navojoa]